VDKVPALAQIRELLARCLDRNPKDRLREIGEARVAIERYLANPALGAPHSSAPRGVELLRSPQVTGFADLPADAGLVHTARWPGERGSLRLVSV
jgi:plasmid stabilization system protein ParE